MNPDQKIDALARLGKFLLSAEGLLTIDDWSRRAQVHNTWFTPENVKASLLGIARNYLDKDKLEKWAGSYEIDRTDSYAVGVVMAGNIPAVGFHDMLCVLLSGHRLMAKLSSQDPVLPKLLAEALIRIEPRWAGSIAFSERLNDAEAIIATGSDNSARYFRYYFGKKPHMIRQNRTSCAVLNGEETPEQLRRLGNDALQYFGLGCRNVSKLFVPSGYHFTPFFEAIQSYSPLIQHPKYQNNYDYNKSIYLVNRVPHLDNGFLLLSPSQALVSPVSVVFHEEYTDVADLQIKLKTVQEKIQCIVAADCWFPSSVSIGEAQQPCLDDYADGVDTMAFLTGLPARVQ